MDSTPLIPQLRSDGSARGKSTSFIVVWIQDELHRRLRQESDCIRQLSAGYFQTERDFGRVHGRAR